MNYNVLRYFSVLAQVEHYTIAAARLGISQPSLSSAIHNLENELGGVKLFEKSGRNIRLTDEGRFYQEKVDTALNELHAASLMLRDSKISAPVVIRMGVVSGFPVTQFDLMNMLRGKNAICDYLLDITIEESGPLWPEGYPWNRILWDVVAVAWLTTDGIDWLESQLIPSPIPQYDHTISSSPTRHPIRYVYHIERDCLMCHMCEKLITL